MKINDNKIAVIGGLTPNALVAMLQEQIPNVDQVSIVVRYKLTPEQEASNNPMVRAPHYIGTFTTMSPPEALMHIKVLKDTFELTYSSNTEQVDYLGL